MKTGKEISSMQFNIFEVSKFEGEGHVIRINVQTFSSDDPSVFYR